MQLEHAQNAFATLAGGTFVGMDTLTEVKLRGGKKNPMQGRVTKRMTGAQVMCFSNQNGSAYAAMVQRRLVQEGKDPASFELSPRAWGERIQGTPFVEHRGQHYLEVIFLRAGTVQFLLDGIEIPRDQVEGLDEPAVNPEGQGGLENRVVIRTFALAGITALRANGEVWR